MTLIQQQACSASPREIGLGAWEIASFEDVTGRLEPPSDFPCLFSQTAFRRQNVLTACSKTTRRAPIAARSDCGRDRTIRPAAPRASERGSYGLRFRHHGAGSN